MKKIILISAIIILGISAKAQISVTKIHKAVKPTPTSYDSLKNFLGANAQLYKGQVLYLNCNSTKSLLENHLLFNYKIDDMKKSNIYKCCSDNGFNSNYSKVVGSYFEVLDVFKYSKKDFQDSDIYNMIYKNKYIFKLKDKSNNQVIYYTGYGSNDKTGFPFIVVGYFKKMNQLYKGLKFELTKNYLSRPQCRNIETGDSITFNPSDVWTCLEVTIDKSDITIKGITINSSCDLAIKLKNQKGIKAMIPLELEKQPLIYTLKQAKKYENKFGSSVWNEILSGIVKIGFTKEMVRLSWGNPKTINKASYGQQWVYDNQYLYFKSDTVNAFN